MAEGVLETGFRHKLAVGVADAFRYADRAVTVLLHRLVDAWEEFLGIKRNFGKEKELRRITRLLGRESARRGDPAGMTAHHLQHEPLGRGPRHRRHIKARLADAGRNVFRDRAKA